MEKKISFCEICGKQANDEGKKRKGNWLEIKGGAFQGISVWLEKPRKNTNFMLTVGFKDRIYDFCSIKCLVKALEGTESI